MNAPLSAQAGDLRPYAQSWAVSLLLHALAVGSAVVFLGDLKLVPEPEPFKWDVALVEAPELKPVEQPAGVKQSTVPRSEFTEQPTRHMRESLESLPGMTVRQGNGPRDFNISIRGSGAHAGSR